jgi:hypothetical protein
LKYSTFLTPNKTPWDILSLFTLQRFANQGQKNNKKNYTRTSENPSRFSRRKPSAEPVSAQATALCACILAVSSGYQL